MTLPILRHPIGIPAAFTPESIIRAVQAQRGLPDVTVPSICVLDFDGDLTDKLLAARGARPYPQWACFHTPMAAFELDGRQYGIVPRTIGGPFAVLVAEQLFVSGARVVLGLTSAGRVSRGLPLPHVVVIDEAVRDEGTSYHYLAPARSVRAPEPLASALEAALRGFALPVARGLAWTTDAPYRETTDQLLQHAEDGVLAVEMQAASLFALAARKQLSIGVVAHVTNALDATGEPFHKGPDDADEQILRAMCLAGRECLEGAR